MLYHVYDIQVAAVTLKILALLARSSFSNMVWINLLSPRVIPIRKARERLLCRARTAAGRLSFHPLGYACSLTRRGKTLWSGSSLKLFRKICRVLFFEL
jgi:hypothetical protein